jgi:predicted ferric reductase
MRNSGKFTRALTQIKKGDSVYVRGPFGGFTFDESSTQPAIFMAGGIGITPFISIIRSIMTIIIINIIINIVVEFYFIFRKVG